MSAESKHHQPNGGLSFDNILHRQPGKEDWRVVDRSGHHEIDDERCNKTLYQSLSLFPFTAHFPNLNSDIHVKGGEGDAVAYGCNRGMLFGLGRHAGFPLCDGSPE